jgi:hypothetical protein
MNFSSKNSRRLATTLLLAWVTASCENTPTEDTTFTPLPPGDTVLPVSAADWGGSFFQDSEQTPTEITGDDLAEGGPQEPLNMTFAQANSPVALFKSRRTPGSTAPEDSLVPYLAFVHEQGAVVTIRHIKSFDGENVSSQLVIPIPCPDHLKGADPDIKLETRQRSCLPLINAIIPDFLVASDSGRAFLHTFQVNVKHRDESTRTLETTVATRITVPESEISIGSSEDLRGLTLANRLLIHTNDLRSAARRDFKLLELRGELPPGIETSWILEFTNTKLTLEEEIFFEQPVERVPGESTIVVARGAQFFKRRVAVDTDRHFRLRIVDGWAEESSVEVPLVGGQGEATLPIAAGENPLWMYIVPDFASENAIKSMGEYIRPMGPRFCPQEAARFKPEEWRRNAEAEGFVACDALIRDRVLNAADGIAKGVADPIETFFGSFNYLPRLSSRVLGGMMGVLSYRVSMSGTLRVYVRDLADTTKKIHVGDANLGFSYRLPSLLDEMNQLVLDGSATPGLDSLRSALLRKGAGTIDISDDLPPFPFMGTQAEDVLF